MLRVARQSWDINNETIYWKRLSTLIPAASLVILFSGPTGITGYHSKMRVIVFGKLLSHYPSTTLALSKKHVDTDTRRLFPRDIHVVCLFPRGFHVYRPRSPTNQEAINLRLLCDQIMKKVKIWICGVPNYGVSARPIPNLHIPPTPCIFGQKLTQWVLASIHSSRRIFWSEKSNTRYHSLLQSRLLESRHFMTKIQFYSTSTSGLYMWSSSDSFPEITCNPSW